MSLRNGVPVRLSRRVAGSNASRTASPQLFASPPWCTSSSTTSVRLRVVRARCSAGWAATPAYVTTTPWKSALVEPALLRKPGSRAIPTRAAASAHWVLRCSVGATTVTAWTTPAASSSLAIRSAKVVLPAPGVATARKSWGLRRR